MGNIHAQRRPGNCLRTARLLLCPVKKKMGKHFQQPQQVRRTSADSIRDAENSIFNGSPFAACLSELQTQRSNCKRFKWGLWADRWSTAGIHRQGYCRKTKALTLLHPRIHTSHSYTLTIKGRRELIKETECRIGRPLSFLLQTTIGCLQVRKTA